MLKKMSMPAFVPPKPAQVDWDNFRGGWNNFVRENELQKNELAYATNLMLTGLGVPTKRWGTENYFLAGATGYCRGLIAAKSASGTVELLGITDWGFLTKKNNASYTAINGVSWASGYDLEGVQLDNRVYFVNGQRELARYDFSSLIGFSTLSVPGGLAATNVSGATGTKTASYRVTAVSQVGETLGSTAFSLASLPQKLSNTLIMLQWTPVSAASGVLTGYNIYRGNPGDETWLASTDNETTEFFDYGYSSSLLRTMPVADTTGGPIAKYIVRYQDRLLLAGIPGDPTRVLISGRVPYHEKFDWSSGGGYVLVAPDEGEEITGLTVINDRIIVTKERSIYEVKLSTIDVGGYSILDPTYQLITAAQGCSSYRSICAVDNDLFLVNQDGIYILGYEPNILNVLRTNEISSKIRPFFEALSDYDIKHCSASYFNRKYILSFPLIKKSVVYDRERLCFMGPWTTTFGINKLLKFEDSDGVIRLVAADADDNYVTDFNSNLRDDKGTAFNTILKTKKEDFGSWDIFKTIDDMYLQFKDVSGNVNVSINLEDRTGSFKTASSFTVTGVAQMGTTGWGTDMWGDVSWGETDNTPSTAGEESTKRAILSKSFRTYQVEVTTDGKQDNYELLGIKALVRPQGYGNNPYLWTVR